MTQFLKGKLLLKEQKITIKSRVISGIFNNFSYSANNLFSGNFMYIM